ncbi:MAG: AraC family transcriptional regulator, partial [Defluviitaleaceae bacterium]|nr:AraC family transcriptional regulator [Defluviitaleaceae bacterium]
MHWIKAMQDAITFIEANLLQDLSIEAVATAANASSAHFQRIFSIVTGMPVGEYIRARRLSLAGQELAATDNKALDVAVKYGYETAAGFTKAFTRFHGATPSDVMRQKATVAYFAPLTINIDVRGGLTMRRKLIPNLPEIVYDGNNAAFFATILEATLQSMGEDCDKAKLTALSGEGNRFCWTDGKWVFGNELAESINETPFETEHRVLSAIGWNAKYITVTRDKDDKYMNTDRLQIRQDFVSAIDNGYPVIALVNMDDNDMNVFFGYEDDGEKIIGYEYNKGFEPGVSPPTDFSAPITWSDWESKINGYIILQGKAPMASERATALALFRTISDHARKTGEIRGKKIGFAAWESFLHMLEHDNFSEIALLEADAPTVDGVANSAQHRFFIYCDGLCQINA